MTERRREPRVSKVMDATWHALSGAASCRVTDISWQGCFVDARTVATVDDEAILSVTFGEKTIDLRGRVRYAEPRIGFGMCFDALTETQRDAMRPLLG